MLMFLTRAILISIANSKIFNCKGNTNAAHKSRKVPYKTVR